MVGLTLPPYLLSRAIDDELAPGWVPALLGAGLVNAWLAMSRHRTMTKIRMDANFRTVRALVEQINKLGADLPKRASAGDVVTIAIGDVIAIAASLTVTGPGVGAVISYGVVAALLLRVSVVLAVVVLLGVPLLAILLGPLLGRLMKVQNGYREAQGTLTTRLVDLIEGLRVLNAFGGKGAYAARYRADSASLREQGYRVASLTSWVGALGAGLPALFLAAVTWLGARLAAEGAITVGELVGVYGYIAMLVVPVSFFIEGSFQISHGLVAARQVTRFLALRAGERPRPAGPDIAPGTLVGLVSARPEESVALLEGLGGFDGTSLIADHDAALFAGTCARSSRAGARRTTKPSTGPCASPRRRTSSRGYATGSTR
ncbi:ABC transporter transmembrane domain-containing protein [Sphaerisporangium siamense]|uniref:ABC-type multidrug transport system fused ATPase/permease subunit n=1 Tax=Sphaerisporangium siamense TaxID=795645 RepID=A0A7W7DD86_9ACTN|nr:ABC transporter ATP-binding protein [Sphaerisporangium siamense]MBB4704404.1 ABC-type multidrug transport system fused ATPase/permease subunit [Sphaerisporangium siamense]